MYLAKPQYRLGDLINKRLFREIYGTYNTSLNSKKKKKILTFLFSIGKNKAI